jgi:hypothetical protein
MLLQLRADEVEKGIGPRSLKLGENAAAYVFGRRRLMGLSTAALRLLQRPLARQGQLHPPDRLNPLGQRKPPALAKKSFRDIWQEGIED